MHISERELDLPESVIAQLIEIAGKRRDIISLSYGEPDFNAPKPITVYARKIVHKATHYAPPSGLPEFKRAIARKLRSENKIKCSEDNIIVTCGSQEALLLGLLCTLDVSEQVIISNPTFLGYKPTAQLLDIFPVYVDTYEDNNWNIDPDLIKKAIDTKKTKAIIINSPGNPTGNVLSRKTLEEIADIAVEHDLWIFSDEAYEKIVYDAKHVSIASLNGMEKYTITLQTFSKSYAMPGFRIGYAAVPKDLVEVMAKTHIYTTISAPMISQMVGVKALSLPKKYVNKMVNSYRSRRDYMIKRLNEIGLSATKPDGAFYIFVSVKDYAKNSVEFSRALLKKERVAVIPGSEFGSNGNGYIRLSYATDIKLIENGMDRIEKFLHQKK